MVTNTDSTTITPEGSLGHSVLRSVVTHYWRFTVVTMAFVAVGFSLAGTFRPQVAAVALAAIYAGLEGLHDLDLADPEIALDIDPAIQKPAGWVLVGAGCVMGAWLAYQTSWLFIAFVVVETALGLAYNLEWFDGLLHDLDKYGAHNFGLSWGAMPVLVGYFLMAETLTLGILVVAASAAAFSACLIVLYELVKVPVLYDALGVEHARTFEMDGEAAAAEGNAALTHLIRGFALLALGLYIHGVLGV